MSEVSLSDYESRLPTWTGTRGVVTASTSGSEPGFPTLATSGAVRVIRADVGLKAALPLR